MAWPATAICIRCACVVSSNWCARRGVGRRRLRVESLVSDSDQLGRLAGDGGPVDAGADRWNHALNAGSMTV